MFKFVPRLVHAVFSWFENRIDPFKPTDGVHPLAPPTTNWRLIRFFFGEAGWALAVMLALTAALAIVEIYIPVTIGRLIDAVTRAEPTGARVVDAGTLLAFGLMLILVRPAITAVAALVRNQTLSRNIGTLVRWRTHLYVADADVAFFQNDFVGRIAQKVGQTGQAIRTLMRLFTDQLLFVLLYLVGTVAYLAVKHPLFALPLIAWIVLYAGVSWRFLPMSRRFARDVAETGSIFSGRLVDGYSNYMIVRLFTGTGREASYIREALFDGVLATGNQQRLLTGLAIFLTLINGLLVAGGGFIGVFLWRHGLVTAGDIASVIALMLQVQQLSRVVAMSLSDLFESIGILEDSVKALSRPRAIVDRADAVPLVVRRGEIRFSGVRFDYGKPSPPPGGRRAIDGVDLVIRPGERIGLVGPSGAGKSTLVNLLLRLYDVEAGSIAIDGLAITDITQTSLRGAIGVVTQDTSLLHRSLRDNIKYGRPEASDEEMAEAARRARATEFIDGLIDQRGRRGYDAFVGERGVKLSGGQRQRVAIARVLLKNAPILVLDEATSALDSEVEAAIQDSLDELMAGKTVIAIAHRLSTIARMDRLVVMSGGRIVETGSHAELVASGGLYADLWRRQTGGFVAAEPRETAGV